MLDFHTKTVTGYIEGYYGKLLNWEQRKFLIDQLASHQFNSYFYAPKEDAYHRQYWRTPYSNEWRQAFADLTTYAQTRAVHIIAGIAPGLDFNYAHIPNGEDFNALLEKSRQLMSDGASVIALMLDDINEYDDAGYGRFHSEGEAHAQLANALQETLGQNILVVPRAYAQEIEQESPHYAEEFSKHCNASIGLFLCGKNIVVESLAHDQFQGFTQTHSFSVIVWDNLYANDYCPRRLFVGPWQGRDACQSIMLNPTGMLATDALLLDLMADGMHSLPSEQSYWQLMEKHGVPNEFRLLAKYFMHPPFVFDTENVYTSEHKATVDNLQAQLDALEHLLWRWKSPLAIEWYPYLFGLKHDLQLANGLLPKDRILKTQLAPLAAELLKPQ